MGRENAKIIFDEDCGGVVSIFVKQNIAGFGILTNTQEKTIETLQKFVDNAVGDQKNIPMSFTPDGTVVLYPDDQTELTFGVFDIGKDNSQSEYDEPNGSSAFYAYIEAKKEDENGNYSESTIEAYPAQKDFKSDLPDYITISHYVDDGILDQSFVGKYYVYNNGITQISQEGSLENPQDVCE